MRSAHVSEKDLDEQLIGLRQLLLIPEACAGRFAAHPAQQRALLRPEHGRKAHMLGDEPDYELDEVLRIAQAR